MAFPKKNKCFRDIVVDGAAYRWRFCGLVEIHSHNHPYQRRLSVDFGYWDDPLKPPAFEPQAITPKFVAQAIQYARSSLWQPDTSSKNITIYYRQQHFWADNPCAQAEADFWQTRRQILAEKNQPFCENDSQTSLSTLPSLQVIQLSEQTQVSEQTQAFTEQMGHSILISALDVQTAVHNPDISNTDLFTFAKQLIHFQRETKPAWLPDSDVKILKWGMEQKSSHHPVFEILQQRAVLNQAVLAHSLSLLASNQPEDRQLAALLLQNPVLKGKPEAIYNEIIEALIHLTHSETDQGVLVTIIAALGQLQGKSSRAVFLSYSLDKNIAIRYQVSLYWPNSVTPGDAFPEDLAYAVEVLCQDYNVNIRQTTYAQLLRLVSSRQLINDKQIQNVLQQLLWGYAQDPDPTVKQLISLALLELQKQQHWSGKLQHVIIRQSDYQTLCRLKKQSLSESEQKWCLDYASTLELLACLMQYDIQVKKWQAFYLNSNAEMGLAREVQATPTSPFASPKALTAHQCYKQVQMAYGQWQEKPRTYDLIFSFVIDEAPLQLAYCVYEQPDDPLHVLLIESAPLGYSLP